MDSRRTDDSFEAYHREISDGCGCTEMWEYMSEWRRDAGSR